MAMGCEEEEEDWAVTVVASSSDADEAEAAEDVMEAVAALASWLEVICSCWPRRRSTAL